MHSSFLYILNIQLKHYFNAISNEVVRMLNHSPRVKPVLAQNNSLHLLNLQMVFIGLQSQSFCIFVCLHHQQGRNSKAIYTRVEQLLFSLGLMCFFFTTVNVSCLIVHSSLTTSIVGMSLHL